MLPIPLEEYITLQLRNELNDSIDGQSFVNKIESLIIEIRAEILEEYYLNIPYRTILEGLFELDYFLSAGVKPADSDYTKRKKVEKSVLGHKNRGTWDADVKIRVDSITGLDSDIHTSIKTEDWILVGDGTTPSAYYYATMGADNIDNSLGLELFGENQDGFFYINCHLGIYVSTLTANQIAQIIEDLKDDIVPAYFRVYLGYLDTSGKFIEYGVME